MVIFELKAVGYDKGSFEGLVHRDIVKVLDVVIGENP